MNNIQLPTRTCKTPFGATLLAITLLLSIAQTATAQVSAYTFASTSGTYVPITGGTVLAATTATTAANDNVFTGTTAPAVPAIGFPFNFNNIVYPATTTPSVNPNGWITFGTGTIPTYTPISNNSTYDGVISAFGADLAQRITTAPLGELRVQTVGTAPNREFVVQYSNFVRFTQTATLESINFQIRLQENGNKVVFSYGAFTNVTLIIVGLPNYADSPHVGLRGTSNADFNVRTGGAWASTTAATFSSDFIELYFSNGTQNLPASGLTYTFTPPPCFAPLGLSVGTVTTTSVQLNWTANPNAASGYVIQFRIAGTIPYAPAPTIPLSTTTTATITGLSSDTSYEFVIQSVCAGSIASALTTNVPATTLCTTISSFPYLQNFNSTLAGNRPSCWTRTLASGFSNWEVGTILDESEITSNFNGNFAYKSYESEANFISPGFNFAVAGTNKMNISVQIHRLTTTSAADKLEFYANSTRSLTGAVLLQAYPSLASATSPLTLNAPAVAAVGGDGWYNYQMNVPTSFNTAGITYIIVRGTTSGSFSSYAMAFDDFNITVPLTNPCTGTPVASTANPSVATVCSGISFNLSLGTTYAFTGITYQWQTSATLTGTYLPISGANAATYTTSQTVASFYKCLITCTNSSASVLSGAASVGLSAPATCYCTSAAAFNTGPDIGNVTFGTLNNGIATPVLGNTTAVNTYTNFTSLAPTPVLRNTTIPLSVSYINSGSGTNFFPANISVYIDYNADGDFADLGERIFTSTTLATPTSPTQTANILIPNTATIGVTRMRVSLEEQPFPVGLPLPFVSSCGLIGFGGEVEDYLIDIATLTCVPLINGTNVVPVGNVGTFYFLNAAVTPSSTVVTYAITPSLSNGLSFDVNTGSISGTPTSTLAGGTFSIIATQVTPTGCTPSLPRTVIITINPATVCPVITFANTTIASPNATLGVAYTLNASATVVPVSTVTYAVLPSLPAGLTISATGSISGTPTGTTGTASATYAVTARTSPTCSATQSYTFAVNACPVITMGTTTAPQGTVGTAYNFSAAATTTFGTLAYTITPALPASLAFSATTGVISGTPTAALSATSYVVRASSSVACFQEKTYSLVILQNPATAVDNSLSSQIKVSPNPSKGDFSIDFGGINMAKSFVRVYDAQGKQVFSFENNANASGNLMVISLEKFASGIYLLEVETSKGRVLKRLAKQ